MKKLRLGHADAAGKPGDGESGGHKAPRREGSRGGGKERGKKDRGRGDGGASAGSQDRRGGDSRTPRESPREKDALLRTPTPPSTGIYDGTTVAKNMDLLFKGRYSETAKAHFKAKTLKNIEQWLGKELLDKDAVEHALLVKTAHSNTCAIVVLTILTLGLYYFFRPLKDMAILVLLKTGRVLLMKRTHQSIWGRNPFATALMFLQYLLVVLAITMPLMLVGMWLFYRPSMLKELTISENPEYGPLQRLMMDQLKLYALVLVLLWLLFVGWVWTHRQRGYGRRFRREFKAANIAAAQYTLVDNGAYWCRICRRRRASALRLFFGKYPSQVDLDGALKGVPAAQAVSTLSSITADGGGFGAGEEGTPQDPVMDPASHEQKVARFFPCISVFLLIASILMQCFSIHGYYVEMLNIIESHDFCQSADTPEVCTPEACKQFIFERLSSRSSRFCDFVHYVDNEKLTCLAVHRDHCCAGCIPGEVLVYLGDTDGEILMNSLSAGINYITFFLALLTSWLAMGYTMNTKEEKNSIEVEFTQDMWQSSKDTFMMRGELAVQFIDRLFQKACNDGAEAAAPERASRQTNSTGDWLPPANVELVNRKEALNWYEFFEKGHRVVEPQMRGAGEDIVHVPKQCVGIMKKEKILQAWTETPFMTLNEIWYMMLLPAAVAFALVYIPNSPVNHGSLRCSESTPESNVTVEGTLKCALTRPLMVVVIFIAIFPWLAFCKWLMFYRKVQAAVIATNERIFGVYYRPVGMGMLPCNLCDPGMALRVEVFRHSSSVFYGRMNSKFPPLLARVFSPGSWKTGDVIMQSRHGVLSMSRMRGDAPPIYDMVAARLSRDEENLDMRDAGDEYDKGALKLPSNEPFKFGVKDDEIRESREDDIAYLEWTSSLNADPNPHKHVTINPKCEKPLYVWSFMESGMLASAYNHFNNVVVTTDRLRLSSQMAHKNFDCRTCLCWGVCWCGCWRRHCSFQHLPEMKSFLNFSQLKAFSTEITLEPNSFPCVCPCYATLCDMLTSCVTFAPCPKIRNCFKCPGTAPPRTQLWLKWLQRNAKFVQPDLVLSVRPYELTEFTGGDVADSDSSEDLEHRDCVCRCCRRPTRPHKDAPEVMHLRTLMDLVLMRQEEGLGAGMDP